MYPSHITNERINRKMKAQCGRSDEAHSIGVVFWDHLRRFGPSPTVSVISAPKSIRFPADRQPLLHLFHSNRRVSQSIPSKDVLRLRRMSADGGPHSTLHSFCQNVQSLFSCPFFLFRVFTLMTAICLSNSIRKLSGLTLSLILYYQRTDRDHLFVVAPRPFHLSLHRQ